MKPDSSAPTPGEQIPRNPEGMSRERLRARLLMPAVECIRLARRWREAVGVHGTGGTGSREAHEDLDDAVLGMTTIIDWRAYTASSGWDRLRHDGVLTDAVLAMEAAMMGIADVTRGKRDVARDGGDWLIAAEKAAARLGEAIGDGSTFRERLISSEKIMLDEIVFCLRGHGQRLTTEKLIDKCKKINPDSNVSAAAKKVLSEAVRAGVLTQSRKETPRGYGLPEWGNRDSTY